MTHPQPRPVYLSDADIAALPPLHSTVADRLEDYFPARARPTVSQPPKAVLAAGRGRFYAMSASIAGGLAGMKWLGRCPETPLRGYLVLSDEDTGSPLAVMEAAELSKVRTAAISLVAARHLAPEGPARLGILGCGAQAASHLAALAGEFELREAVLFSRSAGSREAIARQAEALGLRSVPAGRWQDAVEGADIVVSSIALGHDTAAFVDARLVSPGALVLMVDHGAPWRTDALGGIDSFFTDDLDATRKRAEIDPHLGAMRFKAELSEIGGAFAREREDETIAFSFAGTAVCDILAGMAVLEAARDAGTGREL